jgi:hypothetical protein
MGPDEKDVATGRVVGVGEAALIGPQKATIAEQLIRSEEYGVSSRIVNGMSQTVDTLTVMGLSMAGDSYAGRIFCGPHGAAHSHVAQVSRCRRVLRH